MIIGQLAGYVLLAFLVDAAITEWRKGKGTQRAQHPHLVARWRSSACRRRLPRS